MKALLFGIFLFLTVSCSQASLAVARYNFETLETKLLDINEKSARSLMIFLGLTRKRSCKNPCKVSLKSIWAFAKIHARICPTQSVKLLNLTL